MTFTDFTCILHCMYMFLPTGIVSSVGWWHTMFTLLSYCERWIKMHSRWNLNFVIIFKQVKDLDCYAFTVHTDMTWRSTVQTKAVYRYISFLLSLLLQENFKLLTSIVVHPIHWALHFMPCVIFVIKRKDFFLGWYFLLLLWPNWVFVQHKFSGFRQPADVSCSICKRIAGLGRGVDTNHGNQKKKTPPFQNPSLKSKRIRG